MNNIQSSFQNLGARFLKLLTATCFLSVNAIAQPLLEITESGPLDFCQGDSVVLCADVCSGPGCGTPYTFEWMLDDTVFISSANCITVKDSGAYCVFLTCASGCKKVKCRRVNVLTAPTASFTTTNEICTSQPAVFTNTSNPKQSTNFNWDFGDGSGSTDENPSHDYVLSGSYTATLTATNSCGQSTATQTVYVVHSSALYNDNCCSEDPALFNPNNYNIINDLTINSVAEYNNFLNLFNNNPVIVKGTITFSGANSYSLTGKIMQFGPFGKMVVDRRVTMTADNCTFTGLQCGTMWQGIEVWGDASQPPTSTQHGKFIVNNSTVSLAHIGILASRRGAIAFNSNYGGGIVKATSCTFMLNGTAIRTHSYPYTSACRVINNSFTGGVLPDPYYNTSSGIGNYYPNAYNPLNPKATSNGKPPYLGHNTGCYKVPYTGNTLQDAETGIENYEGSVWAVDKGGTGNIFTNLVYGFTSLGQTNSPLSPLLIFGNEFTNISNTAIRIWGGKLNNMSRNIFRNIPQSNPQSNFPTGIYLENSGGFYITDNKPILNLLNGIQINNSGNLGGIITDLNDQENGNVFDRCNISTMTWQQNPALQINCNNFNNPAPAKYLLNWRSFGKLANQGKTGNATTDPAGNKFDPSNLGNPLKEIQFFYLCLNPPCPWNGYTYYRHYSHPVCGQCIKPVPVGQVLVNTPPSSLIYVQNQSCDICFSCQNLQYLEDAKEQIQSLEDDLIMVAANLDNGNTQPLLNAINSNLSNGLLKDSLINNSPLSDTVLIALIQKAMNENLPPGIIKQVLEPNLPVSGEVYGWLELLFPAIPQNYKDEITELQMNNSSGNSISSVLNEIESVYNERQTAFNGLALRWVEEEKEDSLIYLLQQENTFDTDALLFGYYLSQGDLATAASTLNNMFPSTTEEQEWLVLQTMILQLAQNGETVLEINSSQEQYLRSLAAQIPETPAATSAKSILRYVFGDDYPIVPPSIPSLKTAGSKVKSAVLLSPSIANMDLIKIGNAYPDPFAEYINIPCHIPHGIKKAQLIIYNSLGSEIARFRVPEGGALSAVEGQILRIDSENWSSGLYFYEISSENGTTAKQKMVKLPK